MKYVIANWKAHKTVGEAKEWMKVFTQNDFSEIKDQFHVIIASPFHTLTTVKEVTDQYTFMSVAAQNLSHLPTGAYTGEVTAQMLYGLVDYSLIGHSERRSLFHETNEDVAQKAKLAKTFGIEPIICVRTAEDTIPVHTKFILYEELSSIGNGRNQPLDQILRSQKSIDPQHKYTFLYGGSVDDSNIQEYMGSDSISGVVVGTASVDQHDFYATIKSALI